MFLREIHEQLGAQARPTHQATPSGLRPIVCVQGLGFVGSAMAIAIASAKTEEGVPRFDVIGIDMPTADGEAKVAALNAGRMPFASSDADLAAAAGAAHQAGNLIATTDARVCELASVIVVDIGLDLTRTRDADGPTVDFDHFRRAIRTVGRYAQPGTLVLVETTVPPGTCENVVAPELAAELIRRGLPSDALLLAHSYERVMPGCGYLSSIVSFWRCYAGHTTEAADACEAFLSSVVDVKSYPLARLSSMTASETAKVLENSYRATTIALMEEWGRFAEAVGIDLFEVVEAIRHRPTHSNMRQPGFGVGGYCLTKDPLFGMIGARDIFGLELDFPFSSLAVTVNDRMPLVSLEYVDELLGGLADRALLLMGVSYRADVADTRYSPSEIFVRAAQARGATVACHDPLVARWSELDVEIHQELPSAAGIDAIIFGVGHPEYAKLDLRAWLDGARPLVLDANNVLDRAQRDQVVGLGCRLASIGRGVIA